MQARALDLFRVHGDLDRRIRMLADAAPMSVVVGAGSSMESGLPDWAELVRRLVRRVATHRGLRGDDVESFVTWTMERESLTAAASLARAELGDRAGFTQILRREVYDGRSSCSPGQTAAAVARLRLALGAEPERGTHEVITTNYDPLLEDALVVELGAASSGTTATLSVARRHDTTPAEPNEIVVRHLHGYLPPHGNAEGTVVLSEEDYHLMQDASAWQEAYMAERLAASTCVFVGTSLTDPNLLRYLHRTAEASAEHVACFARQQDEKFYGAARPAVVTAREAAIRSRWGAAGVVPLFLDNFSDTAQFVSEVARARARGTGYVDLPTRLLDWEQRLSRGELATDLRNFNSRQDKLSSVMKSLVAAARTVLESGDEDQEPVVLRPEERLQSSLWVYRPSTHALVNWASSDRAWRDPETLEPVAVRWNSDFAAVRAFCNGSLVGYSTTDQAATRWNHVVGSPLYLNDDHWGRLPVGAFTIASNVAEPDSALARGLDLVRRLVVPEFEASLLRILDPSP